MAEGRPKGGAEGKEKASPRFFLNLQPLNLDLLRGNRPRSIERRNNGVLLSSM